MRNIKCIIEYDGSRYNGWQRQGNTKNTIQYKLETVLKRMTDEKIDLIASGRTDAGVHALQQVANFKTSSQMSPAEMLDYCNQYLPQDIVVKEMKEAAERFHARYNATGKKYLYRIWNSPIPTAFYRKYAYIIPDKLNLQAMQDGAQFFVGKHDFQAFSSVKSKKKSTIREIYSVEINPHQEWVDIMIHGNGFLYNMVRIMVGTLIEIGLGQRTPQDIPEIFAGKIRAEAGQTAPAQALFLSEVEYN